MTRPRKTVPVDDVTMLANVALGVVIENDLDGMSRRRGIIGMVESVLFNTGNYRGYRYLPSELDADGALIYGYDDTRRWYF